MGNKHKRKKYLHSAYHLLVESDVNTVCLYLNTAAIQIKGYTLLLSEYGRDKYRLRVLENSIQRKIRDRSGRM
jgi:hypothetical protein